MDKHSITTKSGGQGMEAWIQNSCSCGWQSDKHYQIHDHYLRDSQAEVDKHLMYPQGEKK